MLYPVKEGPKSARIPLFPVDLGRVPAAAFSGGKGPQARRLRRRQPPTEEAHRAGLEALVFCSPPACGGT